jgi:hypothetical protein
MKLKELTTLGWAYEEDYCCTCDWKYRTTEFKILAVVTLNTIMNTANTSIFGHFMDAHNIVPATTSPMAQPPSLPSSRHLQLGVGKPNRPFTSKESVKTVESV